MGYGIFVLSSTPLLAATASVTPMPVHSCSTSTIVRSQAGNLVNHKTINARILQRETTTTMHASCDCTAPTLCSLYIAKQEGQHFKTNGLAKPCELIQICEWVSLMLEDTWHYFLPLAPAPQEVSGTNGSESLIIQGWHENKMAAPMDVLAIIGR